MDQKPIADRSPTVSEPEVAPASRGTGAETSIEVQRSASPDAVTPRAVAPRAGLAAFGLVGFVTIACAATVALGGSSGLGFTVLAVGLSCAVISAVFVRTWVARHDAEVRARFERMERRLAELEQAPPAAVTAGSDRVGTMLATMSHELRTPLTAILGFTDLLLDPNDDVSVLRSHAHTIRRNCQHLLSVLNDVLDISRLDAGMIRIERKPTDPVQVVREIVDLLEPRAREKHIELDFEWAPNLPSSLSLDVFRVRQVLLNLVGNAVKFTEEGGVTVRVSYDTGRSEIRFDVVDSGPGIADEHKDLVFAPFQRGALGGRRSKGTGLGLAISKRLAECMNGDIVLATRAGYGSTFTFHIPAEATTVAEHAHPSAAREDFDPWTPRPSWRILVVEDTLEHQKLMYSCLRRSGHAVEVCDNGERCVQRVREAEYLREPYTIVLLDVHLVGADGPATAIELRQHGYRGPILAVTADSSPETRERCLAAGCDGVYVKPIERASLLTCLANLVRGAASADVA